MRVTITDAQVKDLVENANTETDREIYAISFDLNEITINYNWSTPIASRKDFRGSLISAIEDYCTRENIEWEYQVEYSAWCDQRR